MATFTAKTTANNTAKKEYFALISRAVVMSITLLSLLFNLASCTQPGEEVKPTDEIEAVTSARTAARIDSNATLKAVATFPIGAAPHSQIVVKNAKANALFSAQFNAKTVHAYMNTQPTPGKFNLNEVDYWVRVAEKQNVRLHGHCLLYHVGAPQWFAQLNNTQAFEGAVKNHIQTIVGRYKGKIASWDVTNEIFDPNSGAIRQTAFRKYYSNDQAYLEFIKRCFQWAHEADPKAILFYNDYAYETSPAKLEAAIKMANDFKRSSTPIDGLGTQMHIDVNTSNNGIRNAFQRLASTGLQVHASELDIAVNPNNSATMSFTQQTWEKQAIKYQTVATLYKQNVPARLQYGITLWDLSDADTWLVSVQKKNDAPCVFDGSFNKKSAFYGLMAGLLN